MKSKFLKNIVLLTGQEINSVSSLWRSHPPRALQLSEELLRYPRGKW